MKQKFLQILNDQGGSSISTSDEEISPTLRAESHQHEPIICYSLQGGGRTSQNSQGSGWNKEMMFTLNALDVHGVAYGINDEE